MYKVANLKKYIKLFKTFFILNFKSVISYDADFILGIIALVIKNIVNLILFTVPFTFIENINGYTYNELLFIYAFSYTAYAIWHCFFINTISIPIYIQSGELDRIILRPIPTILYILLDGFDEDGWGDLVFGILLFVISFINLKNFKIIYIFILLILLISSSLIYAGISLLTSTISFFTIGNSDFTEITMDFHEFSKYPVDIYNKGFKIIFTFLIPIGFAAFYPSLYFISEHNNYLYLFLSPLVGVSFFIISCILWNLCLRHYKSSGH